MAIALVSNNRGTTISAAAGDDEAIDLPAGASIAVGNVLILTAVYDNSGFSGVDPNMYVSATPDGTPYVDLRGNIWTRLTKSINTSAGVANDSIITDAWICYVQNPYLNGDDIIVTFSFTVANSILRIAEFSGVRPISYSVVTPTTGQGDAGTTATAPAITTTLTGQLVIGVTGVEAAVAVTGDADATNGAWVLFVDDTVGTIRANAQYKITTGVGAQNYATTWAGANDWAAVAYVLDVFSSVASDFVPGDPDYPCVAGFEGLPTETTTVPIDTGTGYRLRHRIFPNANGTQDYTVNYHFKAPETTVSHHVAADLYISGNETPQDEITTVVLPIRRAFGTGTVPAGEVVTSVNEPGDSGVLMTSFNTLELWFDPAQITSMYANYRVLRFGLRYLAWKDDDSQRDAAGEGFECAWRDDSTNLGAGADTNIGAWLVPNYLRDVQYETRWLGEVNPYPRGNGIITAANLYQRACFTVNDLSHMAASDQSVSLILTMREGDHFSQTDVTMGYFELVVELAPERRLGHGVRFVSNTYAAGPVFPFTPTVGANAYGSRIFTALNSSTFVAVPSANEYVTVIREPLPPSPSDYYRGRTDSIQQVSNSEAIGPSLQLLAFTQPRETLDPQPELTQVPISGGVFVGEVNPYDQYYLGVAIFDRTQVFATGPFVLGYQGLGTPNLLQVYGAVTQAQYVKVDGATTFDRIKVLVRPDDLTTASLEISVQQPYLTPIATATISPATALLGEDVGNGWREVSVALSSPITPTVSGVVAIVFSSAAALAVAPWQIAGAAPIGNLGRFGYNIQSETTPFSYVDYAAVLQCLLVVPDQVLSSIDADFSDTGPCASVVLTIPRLTFSNGALYDYLAIERSIDGGGTWEAVVLLEDPANGEVFDDIGVPWDIPNIQYRSTGYRDSDRRAVVSVADIWAGTATAPGAAFGLIDYSTGELYAYTPVDENELEITWSPLNPISRVELHGIDYSVALRSPEERGLQVSVVVAVAHFSNCAVPADDEDDADDYLPEIITPGAQSMSPKPFDAVRSLEQRPRLQLNLPGGHTRTVSLDLGTMSIRTVHGLFLSEITLTDVLLPEVNPYD